MRRSVRHGRGACKETKDEGAHGMRDAMTHASSRNGNGCEVKSRPRRSVGNVVNVGNGCEGTNRQSEWSAGDLRFFLGP